VTLKISEKPKKIINEESNFISRVSSVIYTEEMDEAEENFRLLNQNSLNENIEISRFSNDVKPFI
jgi:hypothetical protein